MFALTDEIKSDKILNKTMAYVGGIAFLALCFKIKLFLPFSPVPISMMPFGALVLGAVFPFRVAVICFLACLFEGFMGSPFLGVVLTSGACFGYYVGMIVSIFFLGKVAGSKKIPLLLSLVIGTLLIWSFGVLHLQFLVGFKNALLLGVVPFIIGDAIKLFVAYGLIQYTFNKKAA